MRLRGETEKCQELTLGTNVKSKMMQDGIEKTKSPKESKKIQKGGDTSQVFKFHFWMRVLHEMRFG